MTEKPILDFRVYTDPGDRKTSPFFYCTVWRTLPAARSRMRKLCTENYGQKFAKNEEPKIATAVGCCFGWTLWRPDAKLMPSMGEIVLCLRFSGPSTTAHECTHAAVRLRERIKANKIADKELPEERLALTVGHMTRQIGLRLRSYYLKSEKVEGGLTDTPRPDG